MLILPIPVKKGYNRKAFRGFASIVKENVGKGFDTALGEPTQRFQRISPSTHSILFSDPARVESAVAVLNASVA